MKSIIKRLLVTFTVLIYTVSISGCASSIKKHPEFKKRHQLIRSVAMIPPEVAAYKLTFKGDKVPMDELVLMVMELATTSELKSVFEKKGYDVKELDLSEGILQAEPELRAILFDVKKIFKTALEDIQRRKKKKFTYTLGPDVNVFADRADCDILVFVCEEGLKKSTGEIVKDVVKGALITAAAACIGVIYIPMPKTFATIIHITIVDANDGAILWYTNNRLNPNVDPESEKQLRGAIRRMLKRFPKVSQSS